MAKYSELSTEDKAAVIMAIDCQIKVLERAGKNALTPVVKAEYDKAIADFRRIASHLSLTQ